MIETNDWRPVFTLSTEQYAVVELDVQDREGGPVEMYRGFALGFCQIGLGQDWAVIDLTVFTHYIPTEQVLTIRKMQPVAEVLATLALAQPTGSRYPVGRQDPPLRGTDAPTMRPCNAS